MVSLPLTSKEFIPRAAFLDLEFQLAHLPYTAIWVQISCQPKYTLLLLFFHNFWLQLLQKLMHGKPPLQPFEIFLS